MNFGAVDYEQILAFWLIFSSFLPILVNFPVFDFQGISVTVKVLTTVVLSYAFFKDLAPVAIAEMKIVGDQSFWFLTVYHSLVGLVVGVCVKSILSIYTSSGQIINQQMGFASMNYFDPSLAVPSSPIEQILRFPVILLVLFSGALIPMFKGLYHSFESLSFSNIAQVNGFYAFFFELFNDIFYAAFLLASPLLFTNIVLNLILGIASRSVPQMNIIMISFVVNISLGLIVLIFINQEFLEVGYDLYLKVLGKWFSFFVR